MLKQARVMYFPPLVHTVYYSEFPPTSLLVEDYRNQINSRTALSTDNEDEPEENHSPPFVEKKSSKFRFPHITFDELMKAHGCAVLRLHLWALSPPLQTKRWFVHAILKPIAACSDLIINSALLIVKIVAAILVLSRNLVQVALGTSKDLLVTEIALNSLFHLTTNLKLIFEAKAYLIYQFAACFTFNLAGPEYDMFFRMHDNLNWSYQTNTPGTFLLDLNRATYLRKRCGWDMTDEELRNYCRPWAPPPSHSIHIRTNPPAHPDGEPLVSVEVHMHYYNPHIY